ncbi:hypothetical protein BDP27DRAFT_1334654 [Rhodocollybia butyracea]|uniref:SH3 domain-containing protein n=1 Tax=Rhodocollybia butyracea TaxID=206335 RepID=A0A9P5U2S3_9AGAR|nr:hypothetical protein BDP27DRAFT_1334654 [Rhodocollybia butyracea]
MTIGDTSQSQASTTLHKIPSPIPDQANSTLTLSLTNNPPVPGFPSPSSSFVPPPPEIKEKRRDEKKKQREDPTNGRLANGGTTNLNTNTDMDNSLITPTTPTPDNLHRQRIIELPTDLPMDDVSNLTASSSAAKAFGAAASATENGCTPLIPATQPLPLSSIPPRTPSNPPTPSSPGFYFPPPTYSKRPNRDSAMSDFSVASTNSVASANSASSLKSTRPAPPSPALSRRTSGVGSGTITTSPVSAKKVFSGTWLKPESVFLSCLPSRFIDYGCSRAAPLPLSPVPSSAGLLYSPSQSSAASELKTATTVSVSTAFTRKSTGTSLSTGFVRTRKPVKVRDFGYVSVGAHAFVPSFQHGGNWSADPQFLGLGADGKGLHVPTPNRVKVVNKALMTSTYSTSSAITNSLNAAYAGWKTLYKGERKERKAAEKAAKRREKEMKDFNAKAKRERERARHSMNSVGSVGSTSSSHSNASSVSSTSSRSDVSEADEREDEDEDDDGMSGWAGFKFGLARLSWGFGHHTATSSTATSNGAPAGPSSTSSSDPVLISHSTSNASDLSSDAFPSRSELERNFAMGFDDGTAPSSESGDSESNNSTDTEGEQYHDAAESHVHYLRNANLDLDLDGHLDSPSPLDYDHRYHYYEDDEYGVPHSAYPSASPYPVGYKPGRRRGDDSFGEEEPLHPGLYRAMYPFEPEGPSEMRLIEGDIIRVIGRGGAGGDGGGGGWAVVVDKYASESGAGSSSTADTGATTKYALVPESYLELVQLDDLAQVAEGEGHEEDEEEEKNKI